MSWLVTMEVIDIDLSLMIIVWENTGRPGLSMDLLHGLSSGVTR